MRMTWREAWRLAGVAMAQKWAQAAKACEGRKRPEIKQANRQLSRDLIEEQKHLAKEIYARGRLAVPNYRWREPLLASLRSLASPGGIVISTPRDLASHLGVSDRVTRQRLQLLAETGDLSVRHSRSQVIVHLHARSPDTMRETDEE